MKAAIVEKPGVLVVRDIPLPEMGEYEALCEILWGATCSGTDTHIIAGCFHVPVAYPTVLGHESVGRVVEVGPRVRNLQVGDIITRVGTPPVGECSVTWGGFAEFGIACDHWAAKEDGRPAQEWRGSRWNQHVPCGIDPARATMIITWRETLSYITRMGFGAGASLLVIGSGGNGLSFAAHAVNLGASCVAMIGNAMREEVARAVGVADCFDYKAECLETAVREAYPEGFDFIIDAVGKRGLLDAALPHAKDSGTVTIYGVDEYGSCLINPVHARGSFTYADRGYDEEEAHEQVVTFIQQGKLDAGLWLDLAHPFPLERIGDAFQAVVQRKCVKALVQISENAG